MRGFDKAVLLVRDPRDSLLAEWNRQSGGHVGHARADKFRDGNWEKFVYKKAIVWEEMNRDWLQNFQGPLLVTFYTNLKDNLEFELKRICEFLNVEISKDSMECVLSRKDGIYKRSKQVLKFDPFDENMKKFLEEKKSNLNKIMWDIDHQEEVENMI